MHLLRYVYDRTKKRMPQLHRRTRTPPSAAAHGAGEVSRKHEARAEGHVTGEAQPFSSCGGEGGPKGRMRRSERTLFPRTPVKAQLFDLRIVRELELKIEGHASSSVGFADTFSSAGGEGARSNFRG
jgi:hypothetical protein